MIRWNGDVGERRDMDYEYSLLLEALLTASHAADPAYVLYSRR